MNDLGTWIRIDSFDGFIWHIPWRKELFKWKKCLETQLVEIVLSIKWNTNISYVCCWQGENEIGYTVQS